MKNIIIIGAGGLGREVLWLIERINKRKKLWNVMGFIDDNISSHTNIGSYSVLGNTDSLLAVKEPLAVACAIGSSSVRENVIKRIIGNRFLSFPNLIDPSVILSDYNKMGHGNIICAGAILTVDITLSNFIIVNTNCTIGHDVWIKEFVSLYPSVNISGNVVIEKTSEIGTGSQVIQGRHIGAQSIIGAGAVVIENIPSFCTAVGVPCKPIKYNNL